MYIESRHINDDAILWKQCAKAYTNSAQISTMHTTHATPQRKHTKHEQKQDLANKEQRFQVQ